MAERDSIEKYNEETSKILNLNGLPFEGFESAAKMRDLLMGQSADYYYQVELFNPANQSDGFVVIKTQKQQGGNSEEEVNKESLNVSGKVELDSDFIIKTYHPALRTYVLHIPLIIFSLLLAFFAVDLWVFFLSLLGLKGLPQFINPELLINGTKMIGVVWAGWLVAGIMINYYGTRLIVDSRGISFNRGIWSRDEIHIRLSEIRTIGLRQGILDRLLSVGILEFASSGTDDMDIRFINMPRPTKVKAEIEGLIEKYK